MVSFDEFKRIDLRVAEVKSCEPHPNADKLWVLRVDLGEEERQLVAGLRGVYEAEQLIGRKIIIVANLAPANLRGVDSEGMLLAAADEGVVSLLSLDKDLPPGAKVM